MIIAQFFNDNNVDEKLTNYAERSGAEGPALIAYHENPLHLGRELGGEHEKWQLPVWIAFFVIFHEKITVAI